MQGRQLHLGAPAAGADRPLGGLNLPLTRQKDQDGAAGPGLVKPVLFQTPHHLACQGLVAPRRLMQHLHRMGTAFAAQHLGLGPALGQGINLQGR